MNGQRNMRIESSTNILYRRQSDTLANFQHIEQVLDQIQQIREGFTFLGDGGYRKGKEQR